MEAKNAPTKTRQASFGKTKSPTSYLLPLTSYLLPPTSYLLPPTSYLLLLTSYLLEILPPTWKRWETTHVKKMGNFQVQSLETKHFPPTWKNHGIVKNQYKTNIKTDAYLALFFDASWMCFFDKFLSQKKLEKWIKLFMLCATLPLLSLPPSFPHSFPSLPPHPHPPSPPPPFAPYHPFRKKKS